MEAALLFLFGAAGALKCLWCCHKLIGRSGERRNFIIAKLLDKRPVVL